MASSLTRSKLVQLAVGKAGRGSELYSTASDLLNIMLRHWAITYRFPNLRKVGAQQTLNTGSTTVALPADFGAGMDKEGMIFGTEAIPLSEKTVEEFAFSGGWPPNAAGSSRPIFYIVDREAGVFRFNCTADQAYPFTPVYYKVPADIPTDSSGDNTHPWVDSDQLVIEGLVAAIYAWKEDEREFAQEKRVDRLMEQYRKGLMPMGGNQRIMLSPERFKTVRFIG